MRKAGAVLAVIAILAVSLVGFLHGVMPHSHGNAEQKHVELSSWLHAMLSRQEMTTLPVLLGASLVLALALLTLPAGVAYAYIAHPQTEALRRGRLKYRAFP